MSPKDINELWQQEAQKLGGHHLVRVIEEIRDTYKELADGQAAILKRMDSSDDRHEATDHAIAILNNAFPGRDTEGHRRYHEVQIEMLHEKRRLRQAIQEKTISGLVWCAIVFLGFCMIKGVAAGSTAWSTWFDAGGAGHR